MVDTFISLINVDSITSQLFFSSKLKSEDNNTKIKIITKYAKEIAL